MTRVGAAGHRRGNWRATVLAGVASLVLRGLRPGVKMRPRYGDASRHAHGSAQVTVPVHGPFSFCV
eukprot:scaffold2219_cov72-Phaeocystis_antarctica.AAC.1